MASRIVTVGSSIGLHARPATLIARAAGAYAAEVTVTAEGGGPVDASSALLLMTLGAGPGTRVTVASADPAAVEEIAGLIAADVDA